MEVWQAARLAATGSAALRPTTIIGAIATVGLVSIAGAPADAAVVMHDNSGQTFKWVRGTDLPGDDFGELPGTFLDITKPASEQSGERKPGTIGKWYLPNQSSSYAAQSMIVGEGGAEVAKTTDTVLIQWQDQWFNVRPTRDYAPGEFVAPPDNWLYETIYYWHLAFQSDFDTGASGIGDPAYLGVRFKMSDNQWHYGWIYFTDYQWPLAWAYETQPNTPIQVPIPAPSAGMLMIVGASGFIQRRSRR